MGVVARDHVGAAVAVDVGHEHLRPAPRGRRPERPGMEGPELRRGVGRLLEPAVLREEIHPAVAIQVAGSVAVRVAEILLVVLRRPGRDRMKPRLRDRLGPVDRGEPEPAASLALALRLHPIARVHEQFRPAVAGHVDEAGRFAVGHVEDGVLGPVARRALRVHEHVRRLARQAIHQDVAPAVAGEVVGEGEKVVGVAAGRIVGCLRWARGVVGRRRELGRAGEVGAVPDRGARGDVGVAVLVEVGDGAALGHEPLGERLLLEGGSGDRLREHHHANQPPTRDPPHVTLLDSARPVPGSSPTRGPRSGFSEPMPGAEAGPMAPRAGRAA